MTLRQLKELINSIPNENLDAPALFGIMEDSPQDYWEIESIQMITHEDLLENDGRELTVGNPILTPYKN